MRLSNSNSPESVKARMGSGWDVTEFDLNSDRADEERS